MSLKIRDTDNGFAALQARLKAAAKGAGVSVGVHAQQGAVPKKLPPGEPAPPAPVTVLDVAIWNEFGLGVPERSFLRAWFDEAEPKNREMLRRLMPSVLKGERTLEQAFELLGLKFVGEVQKRIAQGVPPPNAPETIARKGSSKPLVDTGQLRTSITYKVTPGGPK